MNNLDDIINENNKELNEKWPYILDHPYKTLIIGGSGSGKTNALLNLISQQDLLVCKRFKWTKISVSNWKTWTCRNKRFKLFKSIYWVLNTMDHVYKDIGDYNSTRKRKTFNCLWWHDCRHYE